MEKIINDYLHYGYLPPSKIPAFLTELKIDESYEYTVQSASELLDSIFSDILEETSNVDSCIIPLSGGWDSRILLGMAKKYFAVENIKTYTFGIPGQLDFEIGRKVAEAAGVQHQEINLLDVTIEWEDLLASVEESPWAYVPDSFFNKLSYRKVASGNDIILSGFMGDPLTGGHKYLKNSESVAKTFAKKQAITNENITLDEYDPVASLPKISGDPILSWHQLYDLGVRQAHCITRIISSRNVWDDWTRTLGTIRGTDAELITPFAMKKWIQYWIQAPDEVKENRKLYLDLIHYKFPELARSPSKNFYGARKGSGNEFYFRKKIYHGQILLNRYFPSLFDEPVHMMNYLNYARAFKNREDYKKVLDQAIDFLELKDLTPWLDFKKYKKEHNMGSSDHSKLFLLLIGLALNIHVNGLNGIDRNE